MIAFGVITPHEVKVWFVTCNAMNKNISQSSALIHLAIGIQRDTAVSLRF